MIAIPTDDMSRVADARRRASQLAAGMGFDDVGIGRIAIAISELTTNLVKFGKAGELLLGTFEDATGTGIEAIAVDRGPGLGDVERAQRDGYSTAGTAGQGLGAIRRLCSAFEIASWATGTAVVARMHLPRSIVSKTEATSFYGQVVVPIANETVCGDDVCVRFHEDGWTVFLADGLGHGPMAAQAAHEAVRIFASQDRAELTEILTAVHEGIRHTRGAAVAVCRHLPTKDIVRYAGLGNIEGRVILGNDTKRMVSHAGTAGLAMRRVQEFEYPFHGDSVLVMHSDGLASNWSASTMPGLFSGHPTLAAAMLYRQFTRGRDDACVVVAHVRAR